MLWELIATVFAGLGAAGIALLLRKLSSNRAPRWLIPVFAGAAMLGFQIQGEYSWYQYQASRLPAGVVVVKAIEQKAAWRPWSYLYPQTLRFIAADVANASANTQNPDVKLVDLYFFERRAMARRVPVVLHCGQMARADFTEQLDIPISSAPLSAQWQSLSADDALITAVCTG
ncbi:hypothetical protein [Rheinheimera baltica]|uniref:Uncharacterized protein n=1 Tax=Rheinheimera baltica TaxID=67576 RepID=A0ABT9HWD0_9GAMM|nr:hypothetical protein [Rheinheimera baltica]MDP5135411.1 hypothetical protein [Rheinheimera baltica]MDP5144517.1 hypothetical protein [Rheinheimera baltica]MDP5190726.1 hypothetical protein [Rheinheimera baltica]